MRGIAFWFLATAAVLLVAGMAWGIAMSASGDHGLAPAHGHLNLLGWVTMALFGIFYALTPRAAAGALARVHYALSLAAVLALVAGIVMAITGSGAALAKAVSVLSLLTVPMFPWILARHGFGGAATGG